MTSNPSEETEALGVAERRFLTLALILVVVAALSALVILTCWPHAQSGGANNDVQQEETHPGQRSGLGVATSAIAPDANDKSGDANGTKNEWPDFWIALGTIWLVCGTIVLGFWTFRLWAETRDALKQARTDADLNRNLTRDLFLNENRAWVSVRLNLGLAVAPKDQPARMNVRFDLRNHGHLPAFNVLIYVNDRLPIKPGVTIKDTLAKDIANRRESDSFPIGDPLFPADDPHREAHNVAVGVMEYDENGNATALIRGWIQYQIERDGKLHFTPWAWELRCGQARDGSGGGFRLVRHTFQEMPD